MLSIFIQEMKLKDLKKIAQKSIILLSLFKLIKQLIVT